MRKDLRNRKASMGHGSLSKKEYYRIVQTPNRAYNRKLLQNYPGMTDIGKSIDSYLAKGKKSKKNKKMHKSRKASKGKKSRKNKK